MRTNYESLVVYELFCGVVQRFKERISVDSLAKVQFDGAVRDTIIDGYSQCCRHMEGHLHSDKYAYEKPTPENLIQEINRFIELKKKIVAAKKTPSLN